MDQQLIQMERMKVNKSDKVQSKENVRIDDDTDAVSNSKLIAIPITESLKDGSRVIHVGDHVEARTNKGQGDFRPGEVTHVRLKGKSADIPVR